MMRGPSYDDAYITRKMSQMPGPTFSTPGASPYGRSQGPGYMQGYPPMGPPPRMMPRMHPSYYDYDYPGYGGGGYYYMPPPPPPRMSRYDSYLDDEVESPYLPRNYRPRVVDIDDTELKDKRVPHVTTSTSTTTPRISSYTPSTRDYSPGAAATTTTHHYQHRHLPSHAQEDSLALVPRPGLRPHLQSLPRHEGGRAGESEGDRHLARLSARYPSLSEPQMLQDHVDKMRIRLKSLAYSLDPTGPVPEIILPERTKKSGVSASGHDDKKYQSVMELNELPKLASRRQRYYPEDDQMKENLRIKCLSHYKTTRTQAESQMRDLLPDSSSRLSKYSSSKWEEPDTVFGGPSDRKPYSKAITDGTTEETSEEKKERRKKKKSKERELAAETAAITEASSSAAPAADVSTSEVDAVSVVSEGDALDDEKERKKVEKKKRKAEREAAAKAAMEAELAALAAAEAELARLEQESSTVDGAAPEAAPEPAPEEVAAEVKSESAAEKCESSGEAVSEGVCVTPDPAPPTPLQSPPQVLPQVLEEPKAVEPPQEPQPEPPVEEPVVEPPVEEPTVEPQAEELLIDEPPPLKDTRVELEAEKPQVEPTLEEAPVVEPPVEESNVEQHIQVTEPEPGVFVTELKMEPSLEESETPIEAPIEKPAVEEVPVEPPVEEALAEEPVVAPPVEAEVVVEAGVEDESPVWQPRAPRRTAMDDDEPGWLDEWAGEAPQEEAVGSTKLGTAVVGAEEGGGEGAAEAGEGTAAGTGGETEGGGEVEAEPAAPTPAEPEPEPAPEPADEPEAPAPADEPTPAPAEEEADVPEVPVTQRSEEELEE